MKNIIYMYSNLDRSNKLLIIIILVIIALLIIIGLYNLVMNIISKIKAKKHYRKIDKEINEEFIKQEKEEVKKVDPVIEKTETKEEIIENYNTSVKEEMEEIETLDESVSDIDEILVEMMNIGSQEEFDLTDFEREQEENAIISYGELCKKAGVQQVVYPKKEVNKEIEKKIEEKVYNNGKFRPSTFVSPIYGVEKEEKEEDTENEFLGRLKEFRSGL